MVWSELVKVAGVAPTELQELGCGSQSQPILRSLHRARLVIQTAPVSFGGRFLLFIYKYLSFLSIFFQYNLFLNLQSLFCGSQN